MKIRFHRSHILKVVLQKPGLTRAFVFEVTAGFLRSQAPAVDVDSGMVVNLTEVDAHFKDLADFWQRSSWQELSELFQATENFLQERAESLGVLLEDLRLKEARGFALKRSHGKLAIENEILHEAHGSVWQIRYETLQVGSADSLEKPLLKFPADSCHLEASALLSANSDWISCHVQNLAHPSVLSSAVQAPL